MLVYAKITTFSGEGSDFFCWKRILWKITGGKSTNYLRKWAAKLFQAIQDKEVLAGTVLVFFFVGPKTDRMKNGRFGWSYIYAPCGDLFPPVGTGRSLAGVWGHTTPTNTASPKKPHLRQPFLNQGQATFSWTPCDPSPPQATKVMKNCDVKEGKEKLGDNFGEKT